MYDDKPASGTVERVKKVLVVDDEPELVELLSMVLADDRLHVLEAYDGQQALEVMREHNPHLVLTDVMMPFVDGCEVCRVVKADPATSGTTVILMSAAHNIDLRRCGADDFIPKPFDFLIVANRVKELLLNAV